MKNLNINIINKIIESIVKESNVNTSDIKDDSEKSMTPRAMAAFQQHQDQFVEPGSVVNNKRFPNDKTLSRHDSSSSIPCSSDMISVKNIEFCHSK